MMLLDEIADVFNHVHQSHGPADANELVLADAVARIAFIVDQHDPGAGDRFLEVATMSGLPACALPVE